MKHVLSVFALLFMSSAAIADDGFSCEKIKEKSVRVECINDRTLKERTAAEATRNKLAQEENERGESEKNKISEFIKKMQGFLTVDFKDPMSVQFSELVLVESPFKALCGMVNGKNSYGGYVGNKPFYVQEIAGMLEKRIIDLPKEATDQPVYEAEMNLYKVVCANGKPFP